MKKNAIYIGLLSIVLFGAGCQREMIEELPQEETAQEVIDAPKPEYDTETGKWLVPSADPYTFDNFMQAYENIVGGVSPFAASAPTRSEDFTLAPTHYHVKLVPKTYEQVMELYQMEGVEINAYPFNMNEADEELTAGLQVPDGVPQTDSIPRYYHTPEEPIYVEDGAELDMEPYRLPVLYAVWPVGREFPEDCDCYILYEVFLPKAHGSGMGSTRSGGDDFLSVLEQEAIRIVVGEKTRGTDDVIPSGYFYVEDTDIPAGRIAMASLPLRLQWGANTWNTTTNSNGYFNFGVTVSQTYTSLKGIMQGTGGFIITDDNDVLFTTMHMPGTNKVWTILQSYGNSWNLFHIFRAANFFHNGNHTIHKNCLGRHIKFYSGVDDQDVFSYGPTFALIRIYDKVRTGLNLFGTVCHEHGHNCHACKKGRLTYDNAEEKQKESWASFVGWHLANLEYTRLGYDPTDTRPLPTSTAPCWGLCSLCDTASGHSHSGMSYTYTNHPNFFTQPRQFWPIQSSSNYTPFYIDLVDDSNQRKAGWVHGGYSRTQYMQFVNDNIKNVPVSVVQNLCFEYQNLRSSADQIKQRYLGTYFTQQQWMQMIEVYNNRYGWGL